MDVGSEDRTLRRVESGAELPRGRPRLQPVDMDRGAGSVTLVWNDGHTSVYAYDDLRRACPCASCRTERENPPAPSGLRVLPANAPVEAVLADVQWVGWYAFRLAWADGHDTGIYSFDYLRALCRCPECAARKTAG